MLYSIECTRVYANSEINKHCVLSNARYAKLQILACPALSIECTRVYANSEINKHCFL
jgi:hypothetical protein